MLKIMLSLEAQALIIIPSSSGINITQVRRMGGGGHPPYNIKGPYNGFHVPEPDPIHVYAGLGFQVLTRISGSLTF